MATRLLSFLTEIERALLIERAATTPSWSCQRIVNFKDRLARMTLSPAPEGNLEPAGGSIMLQSFLLGDGSLCLRAVLSWDQSPATTTLAVHAKPRLDWAAEARQIASVWLAGPAATATIEAVSISSTAETSGALPAKQASG